MVNFKLSIISIQLDLQLEFFHHMLGQIRVFGLMDQVCRSSFLVIRIFRSFEFIGHLIVTSNVMLVWFN